MADIFGTLSICRRAGKLVCGTDEVKNACQKREAKLVLLTADLSENSKKDLEIFCTREKVPLKVVFATMDDAQKHLGKRVGVMAVCDGGFARAVLKLT